MHKYTYVGGGYDGTDTENSPTLPEFEDFDVDDGPVRRYERTTEVTEDGYVIYRFVGAVE